MCKPTPITNGITTQETLEGETIEIKCNHTYVFTNGKDSRKEVCDKYGQFGGETYCKSEFRS